MNNGPESKNTDKNPSRSAKRNENRRKRRRQNKQAPKGLKAEVAAQHKAEQVQIERKKRIEKQMAPIVVPRVQEPVPTCAICGKPIDAIAQAICGPEPDAFNHFDCVLRKIADDERILPTQKVSYIGKGVFAIVETDAEGHFVFVKRIPYESPEVFQSMKRFVEDHKR